MAFETSRNEPGPEQERRMSACPIRFCDYT
jgi:hypothetical protein